MKQSREIRVTGDGSHTLFVPELNESYHSTHGAIQESIHVFIQSGIQFFCDNNAEKQNLRIFEVGFGTGLNALLSAIFAEEHIEKIYYESVEILPVTAEEISELNYAEQLNVAHAGEQFQKIHSCRWENMIAISDRFSIKKVKNSIHNYAANGLFDICFFDAFAPSKQPEMWTISVLEKIHGLLAPRGIFVTYCAKGQLKRDLRQLGFEVQSISGPPGKKEMVRAIKI